jgi:hypothetical protein
MQNSLGIRKCRGVTCKMTGACSALHPVHLFMLQRPRWHGSTVASVYPVASDTFSPRLPSLPLPGTGIRLGVRFVNPMALLDAVNSKF